MKKVRNANFSPCTLSFLHLKSQEKDHRSFFMQKEPLEESFL